MLMGLANLFAKSDVSLGQGFLVAAIGVVTVFLVLVFLILMLTLLEQVFKIKIFRDKQPVKAAPAVDVSDEEDEEIVAAITAAISMMYESERDVVPPFKIRSIKLK